MELGEPPHAFVPPQSQPRPITSSPVLQILLHGGTPVIRYDPTVTHIVADPDVDEPAFLKFLGIGSRKEIDPSVKGVSYEWVSTSIRVSRTDRIVRARPALERLTHESTGRGYDGQTRVLQPLEPYLLKRPTLSGLAGPGPGTMLMTSKKRELSAVEAIRIGKRTKRRVPVCASWTLAGFSLTEHLLDIRAW